MSSVIYSARFIELLNNWYSLIVDISIKGTLFLLLSIFINFSKFKISSRIRYSILLVALNSLVLFPAFYLVQSFLNLPTLSLFSQKSGTYILPVSHIVQSAANSSALSTRVSNYGSNSTIRTCIFFIWLIGFILLIGRLFIGFYKLREIIRVSASEASSNPLYNSVKCNINIKRSIKFYISDLISTPVTYGTLRPVILLPCGFEELHEEHKKIALMHEMYHIKRMDHFIGVMSQIILAIFWFNPLLWIAVKKLHEIQEENCDDGVLHFGVKPHIYADFMLDLVMQNGFDRFLEGIVSPMAKKSTIEKRILHILDKASIRDNLSNRAIRFILLGVFCLMISLSFISTNSTHNISKDEDIKILIDKKMVSIHGAHIDIDDALPNEIPIAIPLSHYWTEEYLKCSYSKNNASDSNAKILEIQKGLEPVSVSACADGKVIEVGENKNYGKYIIISHKYGFSTVYSNINEIEVVEGQEVTMGQIIGCTGNNNSLSLQVKYNNSNVDPILFLKAGAEI
ncbi:MAG: M56 family metallopeptidase [Bacillota bacterium]|nr:M56 family metallopeptidase [Bacillota bacterium]